MKVVVTGAPGWLGTRLVEVLRERGYEVKCLVLPHMDASALTKVGAHVHHGDISEKETLAGLCAGADGVFHCAGMIHPKFTREFFAVNVDGTRNLLEAATAAKVKKFVFVSSNSACGTNESGEKLMSENDPEQPAKSYGKSKYLAEQVVKQYQREGRLQTVIIRPCWFYGPRQPARVTKLMQMIKNGKPVMFGDGNNLRSMSYIDNVVDALVLAYEKDAANGQTYWIADPEPHKTIDIYGEIAKQLGVPLRPLKVPSIVSSVFEIVDDTLQAIGVYNINVHVAGEMTKHIACSVKKAQKELGYVPRVSFEEGMRASVEWCKKQNLL